MRHLTPVAALACGLLLTGCAGSPKEAGRHTTTAPSTTSGSPQAPTVEPATYTDTPAGQPGYALVVNPGPAGSDTLGGVAVFAYQDGKEAGYFSFSGRAASPAPFTLTIKGDPAATTATAQVTTAATTASTITIEDCDRLFSPAVVDGAEGEANPPAPVSCTFSDKLAPGPPRPAGSAATNLAATAAINNGLVDTYPGRARVAGAVRLGHLAGAGVDVPGLRPADRTRLGLRHLHLPRTRHRHVEFSRRGHAGRG